MKRTKEIAQLKEELRREILEELSNADISRFGLLTTPDAIPVAKANVVLPIHLSHKHDEPENENMQEDGEGHAHMHHFTMFRRDAEGNVIEVNPNDIPRDTSGYGPDGNDEQGHHPTESGDQGSSGHEHDHGENH